MFFFFFWCQQTGTRWQIGAPTKFRWRLSSPTPKDHLLTVYIVGGGTSRRRPPRYCFLFLLPLQHAVLLPPFFFATRNSKLNKNATLFLPLFDIIFFSPLDPTAYKRFEPPLLSDTETGKHTWDIAKVPNVDCLETCALEFIVSDRDGIPQGNFYSHPFGITATGEPPQTAAVVTDKSAPGTYRIFSCSLFFSFLFFLYAVPQGLVHGADVFVYLLCIVQLCSGAGFQPECSNTQRSNHSDPERRERRAVPRNHRQCQCQQPPGSSGSRNYRRCCRRQRHGHGSLLSLCTPPSRLPRHSSPFIFTPFHAFFMSVHFSRIFHWVLSNVFFFFSPAFFFSLSYF